MVSFVKFNFCPKVLFCCFVIKKLPPNDLHQPPRRDTQRKIRAAIRGRGCMLLLCDFIVKMELVHRHHHDHRRHIDPCHSLS